jgi:hypothetical protein
MANAEVILNLWYIHDDAGLIYYLLIRAYVGTGTDEEKVAMLHHFANIDYVIARPFPIPERFHVGVVGKDGEKRLAVAGQELLSALDSPIALFEDAIKAIDAELPAQTGFSIPEQPVFCTTALWMDDVGRLYSGRRTVRLVRGDEVIDLKESAWALTLTCLVAHGWAPSVATDTLMSNSHRLNRQDAAALAAIGQEILGQALRDPLAMKVRIDLAKLAAIVDLAARGAFHVQNTANPQAAKATAKR